MSAVGNYIDSDDIDNFAAGLTDAEKLVIIERIEERVEKLTHDVFYPKGFSIYIDGNGKNRIGLGLNPDILSIASIKIAGVAITSSYWTHDKNFVFLDPAGVTAGGGEAELRWLLKQYEGVGLFPAGENNLRVVGTKGWPERLTMDNVSGTFEPYETITGGTSAATAVVDQVESLYLMIRGRSGTFVDDEEITGGTSEATADVNNADGAVNDPPDDIKTVCIIMVRNENDTTEYDHYRESREEIGGYRYETKKKPITGIWDADILIEPYVRKKPILFAV